MMYAESISMTHKRHPHAVRHKRNISCSGPLDSRTDRHGRLAWHAAPHNLRGMISARNNAGKDMRFIYFRTGNFLAILCFQHSGSDGVEN
jgi:hypothetical protein